MYQNVQLEQNIQEINNFVPICFQLEHWSIGCLVLYIIRLPPPPPSTHREILTFGKLGDNFISEFFTCGAIVTY